MPVIQPIQARSGLGGAPRPSVQVDGSIGRAVSELGGSLQRAVAAEQEMALRRDQMNMQVQEFRSDQGFRQFNEGLGTNLVDAESTMDPSGQGLTENFVKDFDKKSQEFLGSVPEALRPKFDELVKTSRAGWVDKVSRQEVAKRYDWFRTGISDSQEKLQTQVFNDPELFDAAKADGIRAIDASGLPTAEKSDLKKKWDETLAVTIGERQIRDAEHNPQMAGVAAQRLGIPGAGRTQNGGDVASVIREFEGFRDTPYWDVNANRIGYGSDTITSADGSVKRVQSGDRVSRADAERDLHRRAVDFERTAVRQTGIAAWSKLPPNAQAALVSVAYNYGSLPDSVVAAVKAGDVGRVAASVESLAANKKRRRKEAAIIRGGSIDDNAPSESGMDPRFANLSLGQRIEIYDKTVSAAASGQKAIDAQQKALQAASYDHLKLGIETGDVVSDETVLKSDTIDDGQKATLLKSLRARRKEDGAVDEMITALTSGSGVAVNSFDSQQTAAAEKAYSQILKSVPDENKQAVTGAFVQETGYVPKPEIASLREGLVSDKPNDVVAALSKTDAYQKLAPEQFRDGAGLKDARDSLDMFKTYTQDMGYTDQQAAQRLIDARDPEKARHRDAILKSDTVKKAVKDIDASHIAGTFDQSIGGFAFNPALGENPAAEAAMVSDYRDLFQESVVDSNGDLDAAEKLANTRFHRIYGTSQMSTMGDGTVIKYPPEKTYPEAPDGTHDYIMKQAREALAAEGVETDRIWLQPDTDTEKDFNAGKPPRYQVFYTRNHQVERFNLPFYADVGVMKKDYLAKARRRNENDRQLQIELKARRDRAEDAARKAFDETSGDNFAKMRAADQARAGVLSEITPSQKKSGVSEFLNLDVKNSFMNALTGNAEGILGGGK